MRKARGRYARWRRLILLASVAFALGMGTQSFAAPSDVRMTPIQKGIAAYKAGTYGAARKIFERLAKKKNAEATYWLGRMYEEGAGVAKNTNRAVGYYREAAVDGLRDAEFRLGEIYLHGVEALQNFAKARKWLERSALDGVSVAQRELGTLYANGWGTAKDPVLAYVWFEIAARGGDFEAPQLRDRQLKKLSDTQIAAAQQLTRKIASQVFDFAKNEKSEGARVTGSSAESDGSDVSRE
jgi:TPR repeat protein